MRFLPRRQADGIRTPGSGLRPLSKLRHATREIQGAALPWLSVVFLVALIIIPIALFFWLLFATNVFIVQAVTVIDARPHVAEAAEALAHQQLSRVPFHQNIFFVDTSLIEDKLLTELPTLRTAHVTRQLPGTVKVVLQEKAPTLLLLSGGDYYFVDDTGVPYENARLDTLPGVVLPTVKNNDPDSTVTLGVPAVDASFVSFVEFIQEQLPEQLDAEVAEIRIPSLAAREVHFLLNNNWEVRFDVTRQPAQQLETLRRVVQEVVTADEAAALEYIDLRIPNRVYYKTIGAASTPPTSSPTPDDTASQTPLPDS